VADQNIQVGGELTYAPDIPTTFTNAVTLVDGGRKAQLVVVPPLKHEMPSLFESGRGPQGVGYRKCFEIEAGAYPGGSAEMSQISQQTIADVDRG